MGIEIFRDWVISIAMIAGFLSAGIIAVLAIMFYRRASRIMVSLEAVAGKLRSASSAVSEETLRPIMQLIAVMQGVNQVRSIFQKKQGGSHGRTAG